MYETLASGIAFLRSKNSIRKGFNNYEELYIDGSSKFVLADETNNTLKVSHAENWKKKAVIDLKCLKEILKIILKA